MLPMRALSTSRNTIVVVFVVAIVAFRATITRINGNCAQEDVASHNDDIRNLHRTRSHRSDDKMTYKEALEKAASPDKVLLLVLSDWGYIDMAQNFYESSISPHNIQNYLYVALDDQSCDYLRGVGIRCFTYVRDEAGNQASSFHSEAFIRKTRHRTDMMIEALELGYTILYSDTDIMFLKNPFHHINCSSTCDVRALWDATRYNAGFIYLRPTPASLALYKTMRGLAEKDPAMHDQMQLIITLKTMERQNVAIDIERLAEDRFLCGRCYFEDVPRMFAGDNQCDTCVVVHNNWIVTKEAKRYRAREHLHWVHDLAGYYSKPTAKYLLYSNPVDCTTYWDDSKMMQHELRALQNALAYGLILNRIVILPKFHCGANLCPLNSYIKLQSFDQAFGDKYREHSFLINPKVPQHIKEGRSELFMIPGKKVQDQCIGSFGNTVSVMSRKPLTDSEIRAKFGPIDTPILQFHSMYDTFQGFASGQDARVFKKLVEQGFVLTDYRQQKIPPKKLFLWFQ